MIVGAPADTHVYKIHQKIEMKVSELNIALTFHQLVDAYIQSSSQY